MSAMYEPPREYRQQFALAWHPRWWRLVPTIERKPPAGWRGGWSFTWLFIHFAQWWRFV